ncbi:MAG: glycosyltransferase family 39 protein [Planctomycetaceae bacterium]|nr:glycosyltransferase family 39 protein [Planctomycetaceae bacterium]
MTDGSVSISLTASQACWIVLGLFVPLHVLLLGWLACKNSPTSDEVAHLTAGVRIWNFGDTRGYSVNPPLVKAVATLPVVLNHPRSDWRRYSENPADRREWNVGQDFFYANGPVTLWYFTLARWACIPFSLIGLIYCFVWGSELSGPRGGVLAACLWCFDPNILANASLITPDIAATSFGLATVYHFQKWLHTRSWQDSFYTGVALGLAQLTKMTWVMLYIWLPLLWGIIRWVSKSRFQPVSVGLCQWGLIVFLSLEILNAGYGFQGTFEPLGKTEFVSRALTGDQGMPGNRFRGSFFGMIPMPVPVDWLIGMDLQKRDFEQGWRPLPSYLRGELRMQGWWYYYLYAAAVKTPLSLFGLIALSAISLVSTEKRNLNAEKLIALLFIPIALFLFVSFQTGFSRYYRYVLPCLPYTYLFSSQIFQSRLLTRIRWMPWATRFLVLLLCLESLAVSPHQLGFYNVLAGGPAQGHTHLLDSNTDWGQDLYSLKDWMISHPEARPMFLSYSGVADPRFFEIGAQPIPVFASREQVNIPKGWYAISVNHLHDYELDRPFLKPFQKIKPVGRAGFSILIYHLDEPMTQFRVAPGNTNIDENAS